MARRQSNLTIILKYVSRNPWAFAGVFLIIAGVGGIYFGKLSKLIDIESTGWSLFWISIAMLVISAILWLYKQENIRSYRRW